MCLLYVVGTYSIGEASFKANTLADGGRKKEGCGDGLNKDKEKGVTVEYRETLSLVENAAGKDGKALDRQ